MSRSFQRSCDSGDAAAQFALGKAHESGNGVPQRTREDLPQDFRLATAWYRKAGDRGDNRALISLALLSIAAKDYGEASHWCETAAEEKYPLAYFCLGSLYKNGLGVVPDSKKAFHWYQQGTRGGHSLSMLVLAQMYATEEGTKLDRPEALLWFLESGRRGNKNALIDARKVRSSMTEDEWKDAQKKLRQTGLSPRWVEEALRGAGSPPTP